MPTCSLRHDKLKTFGQIANLQGHVDRTLPCQNADPTLSHNNFDLIGLPEVEQDLPLEVVVRTRIGNQTIRKNAVLACEMLLNVSPEYFRPDQPKEPFYYQENRVKEWVEACKKWLLQDYGTQRILKATVHLDEATPHIHVVYVPFDEKGKLNARGFIGAGRWNMSLLQDRYHAAIAHLGDAGIERGKKRSKAKYQDIRQFYSEVNQWADERRQDWATDIAQITLINWLEGGEQDIRGKSYTILRQGDYLEVSHQERGQLMTLKIQDGSVLNVSDQLQQADLDHFKQVERRTRIATLQKARQRQSSQRPNSPSR
jgi:hypothetical protein